MKYYTYEQWRSLSPAIIPPAPSHAIESFDQSISHSEARLRALVASSHERETEIDRKMDEWDRKFQDIPQSSVLSQVCAFLIRGAVINEDVRFISAQSMQYQLVRF